MGESLAAFFNRNARLFTILGVFGAISVYFTQLDVQSRWQRLGVVSSLTIFLLVAVAIQRSVPPDSSDDRTFDFIIKRPGQRGSQAVFYISFYAVVLSVIGIVAQFSNTVIFLSQFFCIVLGIRAVARLVELADSEQVSIEIGTDPRAIDYFKTLLWTPAFALITGGGSLWSLWLIDLIPLSQLVNFQIQSLGLAVIIGILAGVSLGGAVYSFIFMMLILLHLFLSRLWIKGSLEEFGEFYQRSFLSGWDEE